MSFPLRNSNLLVYCVIVAKEMALVFLLVMLVGSGLYVIELTRDADVVSVERQLQPGWFIHNSSDGLDGTVVFDLIEEESGAVWANTLAGLYRYEDTTWRSFPKYNKRMFYGYASSLTLDTEGRLWFTLDRERDSLVTAFGLWCFENSKFQKIKNGSFEFVLPDPEGGVWVCNRYGYKSPLRVGHAEISVDLSQSSDIGYGVSACAGPNDTLFLFLNNRYLGTAANYGLNQTEPNLTAVHVIYSPASTCLIVRETEEKRAKIWTADSGWTGPYENVWTALDSFRTRIQEHLPSREWNRGLWARTAQGTLVCKNKVSCGDGSWKVVGQLSHFTPLEILCVLVRRNGEIWFGTAGEGIYVCECEERL